MPSAENISAIVSGSFVLGACVSVPSASNISALVSDGAWKYVLWMEEPQTLECTFMTVLEICEACEYYRTLLQASVELTRLNLEGDYQAKQNLP